MALGATPIRAQQRSSTNIIVHYPNNAQVDLFTKQFPKQPYIALNKTSIRFPGTNFTHWNSTDRQGLKIRQLAPDFYYQNCYGFFCKMEWRAQNQWHLPITFRLGAYHYERRLEGEE